MTWRGKKPNIISIFKKEDLGNYRLVSLASVLGKVKEQILLEVMSKNIRCKKVITRSQHGFIKDKLCLIALLA